MGQVKSSRSSTPGDVVHVNVKLTPQAKGETVKKLSAVRGVEKLVQTFPNEQDPELSRLYVLKLNSSHAKVALEKLRQNPDVEYAEQAAPRKLIW